MITNKNTLDVKFKKETILRKETEEMKKNARVQRTAKVRDTQKRKTAKESLDSKNEEATVNNLHGGRDTDSDGDRNTKKPTTSEEINREEQNVRVDFKDETQDDGAFTGDQDPECDAANDVVADVIDLVRSNDLESLTEGFKNFGPEKSAKLCVDSDRRGLSPLTLAAEMNRVNILKFMIEQHPDVNVPNEVGGWTALHCASSQGHVEITNLLLASGARVDDCDRDGWSALHFSSDFGCLEIVRVLAASGSEVNNSTSKERYTPLYLACAGGHVELVDWLLTRGADVKQTDKDGWTAMHAACCADRADVVELLLKYSEDAAWLVNCKTCDGITPLYLSAQHGYARLAKLLMDSGALINVFEDEGFAPLHVACQGGHHEVVECILGFPGSDANLAAKTDTAWCPVHFASQENHDVVLELLLERGADVDAATSYGHTALHLAAGSANVECQRVLISKGANLEASDQLGWSPLHHAAQNGHTESVRELLQTQRNALVDLKTSDGCTSLLISVLNDHVSIVRLLIEYGAKLNGVEVKQDINKEEDEKEEVVADHFPSLLHAACEVGNPSMIELLVSSGAKVDAKDEKNWTPLHCLAEMDNTDCIDALLSCFKTSNDSTTDACFPDLTHSTSATEEGTCHSLQEIVDAQSTDGHTALFLAAYFGHLKTVKHLLKLGAKVSVVDYLGWSALHAASARGHAEVVKCLLNSNGLDVNRRTYHGFTPLYLSIQEKQTETAEFLLNEALSDPNLDENQGSCPLHVAAQHGLLETTENLLNSGALTNKTDSNGWTALHFAVQDGNLLTVRKLVEHGSDVDARTKDGVTSLFIAVHKNFEEIINFLLQHGARTDLVETATGLTPLHLACGDGHTGVVQRLLTAGANTEAETKYDRARPLYMAIRSKSSSEGSAVESIVRTLLLEGADPMPPCISGLSALHIAAQKGMTGVVRALVEYGAPVESMDEAGWTPLMFSSRCGQVETVRALLAAGANPDNQNKEINNSEKVDALLLAVQNGHIEVVETLILWSCNVNARTRKGTTALYCASQHGDLEMVQMLLYNGADPNLQDKNGFIPLHPACLNGHKKVAESLVKAGSAVDHPAADGSRPIQLADRNEHEEIVEWLLLEGAKEPEFENKLNLTWGASLVSGWGAYIKNVLVKMYKHGMDEYVRLSADDDENDRSSDRREETLKREAAVEQLSVRSNKMKTKAKFTNPVKVRQVQRI